MKKKKIGLIVTTILFAMCLVGCGSIQQTKESITVEAGQQLDLKATDFLDMKEEAVTLDTKNVDINTVGEYKVTATYKKQTFELLVKVEDTTAPSVELKERVGFTNAITTFDTAVFIDSIYDASAYTVTLKRFQKSEPLLVVDDTVLKRLNDSIPIPCDQEKLSTMGTEELPMEEGIYQCVLEIKDQYENSTLEEVYLVFDQTGGLVADVEDKTVEQADVTLQPELIPTDYAITDNVDGVISTERIKTELTVSNAENHEYLVVVSYVDRAGNESKGEFLIQVVEATKEEPEDVKEDAKIGNKDTTEKNPSSEEGKKNPATETAGKPKEETPAPEPEPTPEPPKTESEPDVPMYTVITREKSYIVFVNGADDYAIGSQMLEDHAAALGMSVTQDTGGWYDGEKNIYSIHAMFDWVVPSTDGSVNWDD